MKSEIPYMISPGGIPKILEKAQNARRPERFTQDFLSTKLGHGSSGARPIIPLLKRMEFLGGDGVPTSLYDQFRNHETAGAAVASGMRIAYKELFDRNEYVYELSKDKLVGLIVQTTGRAKDDRVTQAIVGTFVALKEMANFEDDGETQPQVANSEELQELPAPTVTQPAQAEATGAGPVDLRVGYTINLNLPETSDPEVFNAIFKSLKENLLNR